MFKKKDKDNSPKDSSPEDKDKGKITEDEPDKDGKVTVRIAVEPVSRYEKDVSILVIEQATDDTVFKSDYKDRFNKAEYFAYQKAEELVRQFCRQQDYVPDIINSNLAEEALPNVRTAEKRSR